MPDTNGKRGDLRLTLPPRVMSDLKRVAERERRDIQQQARLYIERGIEAEKATAA